MTPKERLASASARHEQLEELRRRVIDLLHDSRAEVQAAHDALLAAEDAARAARTSTPAEVR